jgi:hypothetical protein
MIAENSVWECGRNDTPPATRKHSPEAFNSAREVTSLGLFCATWTQTSGFRLQGWAYFIRMPLTHNDCAADAWILDSRRLDLFGQCWADRLSLLQS